MSMKPTVIRFVLSFVLPALFLSLSISLHAGETSLETGFRTPPNDIRPSVYWYWVNDNISKEGIVKDLEAMKEIGIGRAFIGNIGEQGGGYGSVKIFSNDWWDAVHEALRTATRLGIDLGMFNSPGWSQSGGPWVKPERSMRYLATSATTVVGPKKFEGKLETPGKDFQDVKVLAFKSPKNAGDVSETSFKLAKNGDVCETSLAGDHSPVRNIAIVTKTPARATVEISAKIEGQWKPVKTARFDRSNPNPNVGFDPFAPVLISIPATCAKDFQLKFTDIHGTPELAIRFRSAPAVESVAEKTLAKMWPTPLPLWDAYMWPDQPKLDDPKLAVDPKDVLDISQFMQPDGTLTWDVPEGEWTIQRTGMLTTGVQNGPASPEAKGLEIDKMSKEHVTFHFDAYLGEILKRIPEADRQSLKVAVQDSYETGGQNWTDDFIAEFKKTYGYDPTPYIPVMSGVVVGSPEMSDRFLWDLRRFVADKVAHDYVGGLREAANKHGMTTWLECYGHWGFPGEFLQYGGQSDGIAGEFWNEGDLGSIENRAASSCGHIYGKTKITAESFTAGGNTFGRYPRLLKKRCDWSYTEGINDTLLHLYIHQPYEEKTPGMNAWFSTEFNRKNTWFSHMKPFVEYMRRCMFLLQQGQNVADVAYFIGEDCPKMTGVCDPPLPKGYSFDYINGEVIRDKLSVKDGRLVLPHGTSYRLLVLPNQTTMRPETLRKIKELVESGAVVYGPKPTRSPSLQNYPACDEEVRKMADELWKKVDGVNVTGAAVGKGWVHFYAKDGDKAGYLHAVLNALTGEDCETNNPDTLYVHRKLADGTDIYFLTNQVDKPISFMARFRVDKKQPEFWDPVDGTIRPLPAFSTITMKNTTPLPVRNASDPEQFEQVGVPLKLDAWGSAFIMFRKVGKPLTTASLEANFPEQKTVATVDGPWTVRFESDEIKRGPKEPQTFDKLIDWSGSENEAIRYYSGAAVYTTTFKLDSLPETKKLYVNLGDVQVAASVKLNGQDAGILWTAPWQLDVTKFAKPGENTLEVEVVNTWVNRLIGDVKLPENKRKTWATVNPYKPDDKLQLSGLLGPVHIVSEN